MSMVSMRWSETWRVLAYTAAIALAFIVLGRIELALFSAFGVENSLALPGGGVPREDAALARQADEIARQSRAALERVPGQRLAAFRIGYDIGYSSSIIGSFAMSDPAVQAKVRPIGERHLAIARELAQALELGDVAELVARTPKDYAALTERFEADENGLAARIEMRLSPAHRQLYLLGAQLGNEAATVDSSSGAMLQPPVTLIRRHGTLAGVAPALWLPLALQPRGRDAGRGGGAAALGARCARCRPCRARRQRPARRNFHSCDRATMTTTPLPSRRALLGLGGAMTLLQFAGCATPQAVRADAAALVPTGRLRAAINLGNPVLARRNATSGAVAGVSIDLARALADEIAVPLDLLVVDGAARSVETVKGGQADVGFFAVDPLRSDGIRFSAPYLLIEGAYLVRNGSPLTRNDEVDRPGARIVVGRGSAYDLYLSRELKSAQLLRVPTSPVVVDEFLAQNADAAAGVKQQLEADAARVGGVRLLPGRFMVIEQAMGVPAGRGDAAVAGLAEFVEHAKASGFVAAALARHGIQGAVVAPAARR